MHLIFNYNISKIGQNLSFKTDLYLIVILCRSIKVFSVKVIDSIEVIVLVSKLNNLIFKFDLT
jgi:hypothetical protein